VSVSNDTPAGPADPQQLSRGDVGLGREHDAERGQHEVERAGFEREVLGVADAQFDRQAFRGRSCAGAIEELVDVIGRGDDATAARRGEGGVALAGGDVEDELTGDDVNRLAEQLAGWLQRRADGTEIRRWAG
jgi:hypothetical protein